MTMTASKPFAKADIQRIVMRGVDDKKLTLLCGGEVEANDQYVGKVTSSLRGFQTFTEACSRTNSGCVLGETFLWSGECRSSASSESNVVQCCSCISDEFA